MDRDFVMGSGGAGDEHEASNSRSGRKSYHRHTARQIQRLEEFFKECPHPDENRRRQLSMELGLELRQIKFWFQNKRTQIKAQNERADNTVLRAENERIMGENIAMRESLKNVICPSCGSPQEERENNLQKLQRENAHLKEEYEKVTKMIRKCLGKPISQLELLDPSLGSSFDLSPGSSLIEGIGSPSIDLDFDSGPANSNNDMLPYQMEGITDMDKRLMLETAATAMEELIRVSHIDEPLWVRSRADGRFILHRDSYERIFPRANHFKSSTVHVESSKDSQTVSMDGEQLVDMFLNSEKWADLFPTIVSKVQTIKVLEPGLSGSRHGALQLMYEQMHILSPLVPPRELFFLRHCQLVELGVWVIVDVSFDFRKENISPSRCWKLPSGCVIRELPTGSSQVTWVEHVEVDEKTQTHRLYRDLVCSNSAYGAERWVATLERICDTFACSVDETAAAASTHEAPGVLVSLPESRRRIMKLGHRMVKNWCGILKMGGKQEMTSHIPEMNNSGIRVSVRKNTQPGQPVGIIVSAATSLWLPLSPQHVFDFFRDEKTRYQWDVLSNGNPAHEIARISIGTHPGNSISIIRPLIPTEKNVLILQETCVDPFASLVVYAPIDVTALNLAANGEKSSIVQILPSGFVISSDGRPNIRAASSAAKNGSLITVAFQILVSTQSCARKLSMESVNAVNALISSTVLKIREALNC